MPWTQLIPFGTLQVSDPELGKWCEMSFRKMREWGARIVRVLNSSVVRNAFSPFSVQSPGISRAQYPDSACVYNQDMCAVCCRIILASSEENHSINVPTWEQHGRITATIGTYAGGAVAWRAMQDFNLRLPVRKQAYPYHTSPQKSVFSGSVLVERLSFAT